MATNHTTNYQLNLWEPQDDFLRSEFNENTQKIDAAVKTCFQPGNLPWVFGSFIQPKTEDVTVTLGFRPSLLILASQGPSVGVALGGAGIVVGDNPNYSGFNEVIHGLYCQLLDDGFKITSGMSFFNDTKDVTTQYVAFR